MSTAIPVMEIMSRNPVTIDPESKADTAASLMKRKGVGSVIVVQDSDAIGIVTERDIVTKVAAQNLLPSKLKVREIMSSPVISIHPHAEVVEAAKKMNSLRIRRLAVVEDTKLVGLITEKDILKVWPHMIEITREYAKIREGAGGVEASSGYCEICSQFSDRLVLTDGLMLCHECRER